MDDVNKPGSDIEQYLSELERVLEEKNNSIFEMKKAIADFQHLIEKEKVINAKVNSLRKKNAPTGYGQEGNRRYEF